MNLCITLERYGDFGAGEAEAGGMRSKKAFGSQEMTGAIHNQKESFWTCRKTALSALALCALVLTPEAKAQISMQGATAPTLDPRRVGSGAKITAETAPEQDKISQNDEKRMVESYQPKGIEIGLFTLLPKLETNILFNSNVYAERTNAKSDFYTQIRPELSLRSRFTQHELGLRVLAEKYNYRTYTRDNHLDFQADLNGRYDVQPGSELTFSTQYFSRHEDRSSPDEAGGVKPTPTQGFVSRFGGKHEMGRYVLSGDVTAQRLTFDPVSTSTGTTMPNGDRNRWEVEGRVRGSYEMFPGYAAVTQATANTRRYDKAFDRNGFDRSSHGYRIEGGVGVDVTQLLRGDFLVGYLAQNYRDARLSDPSGLSIRATFNWTPDKLLIVVPSLERTVSETTRSGSSSQVMTTGSVLVRYEAERNLLFSGFLSASHIENSGQSPTNWLYEARLRGTYSFTPEVFAGAEAVQKIKTSQGEVGGYKQTTLMIRLGLQM